MIELNAEMARLHITNKGKYEEIKKFLICPFQTYISEQDYIEISKSEIKNDPRLQNAINEVIKLHERCSQKKICPHL